MRDKNGKRVENEFTVDYRGFKAYVRELEVEAGLVDPEVEALAERLRKADQGMAKMERIFGRLGSVVKA